MFKSRLRTDESVISTSFNSQDEESHVEISDRLEIFNFNVNLMMKKIELRQVLWFTQKYKQHPESKKKKKSVIHINRESAIHIELSLMTHTISSASGSANRPRLCRSDHQPNILEYIDTTLNDSFISRLNIENISTTTTNIVPNGSDQFGNTIVDQYLLYILCQKLHPNRTESIYHSLHQLFLFHGKISKSFFEYSPATSIRSNYQSLFTYYTNFIWNEFDLDILLELACFLLKYRLRDIFLPVTNTKSNENSNRQKIIGYFLETIAIYYLVTNHQEFFINSRSKEMLFPYPPVTSGSNEEEKDKDIPIFDKFLRKLYENGEVSFDSRQIRVLLQSDGYQFLNKKLENRKIAFLNFFDTILRFQRKHSCRSLKSLCRLSIKMHLKQYPNDVKQLSLYPSLNDQLLTYLTYENKYAFESTV